MDERMQAPPDAAHVKRSQMRPRRRWAPWLLGVPLGLLLLIAIGGTALWHSEGGLRWALQQVPGLTASGIQGRPTGGAYRIDRLQWQGGGTTVVVDRLAWADAQWSWRPHAGAWIGLRLLQPGAADVQVRTTPQPDQPKSPMQPPKDLRLPLALQIAGLRVDRIGIDALPPVTGLGLDLDVGADGGRWHRLRRLVLQVQELTVQAEGSAATDGEMPLQLRATVASAPSIDRPWRLAADLAGPLQGPGLQATLDAGPGANAAVSAVLAPFQPWPLTSMQLRATDLDLSVLAAGLPTTRLTGRGDVATAGTSDPATAVLHFDNRLPGAWDAGRLPVRALDVEVKARPDRLQTIDFPRLALDLGGERPGGHLAGSARLDAGRLDWKATLDAVQPQRLHGAAPPLTLNGPLSLQVTGLPTPGSPTATTPGPLDGQLRTELSGRLDRRGTPPLRLGLQAAFNRQPDGALRLDLRELDAGAGAARAQATATAEMNPAGRWSVRSAGRLQGFDPTVWLPLNAGNGPSRLTGQWDADLALAPDAPALAGLRGRASFQLDDSRLAGVPLSGTARLASEATNGPVSLNAAFNAAGNRLAATGRSTRDGAAGDWRIELNAPQLANLAPLAALAPAARAFTPRAGSINGNASIAGRWPRLTSQGDLHVAGLRLPALSLDRADAQWRFGGLVADAPLGLQIDAAGLAQGGQRLERLTAALQGTLAAHQLSLRLDTPLRPPAWAGANAGGTRLAVQGNGRWRPLPPASQGSQWNGTLAEVSATPRQGNATPWLLARDLGLGTRLDEQGLPQQAQLAPGRIDILGAALRWTAAQWQAAGPNRAQRVDLEAQLEPLTMAPLLVRLQPQFRWRGDLALGGRVSLHLAERLQADLLLERRGGDIALDVEGRPLQAGLQTLRLAGTVRDGRWVLSQDLASTGLGRLQGRQTIQAPPDALAPPGSSALDGRLQLALPALASWSPWLPAGWRVDGRLQADVALGGRLEAPVLRGEVTATELAARNLLQGVDVHDGRLRLLLDGQQARLAEGIFRSNGDGTLRLQGSANLDPKPSGQVVVTAERFRVLDRVDRRIAMSGRVTADLRERLAVNGALTIDEGRIDITQSEGPTLDTDIVVLNREGAPPPPRPPQPGQPPPKAPLAMDLRLGLDLGQDLRLAGRGLDARLGGRLQVTTPEGVLAVNGVVRIVEGTYTAYGQNLAVSRGLVTFSGDPTNPRLDIFAIRPDIDQRVGITVSGNAVNPRVRLTSEPELPEIDKLSWLVLGRAPEGVGRADSALLQRAAMALLAGDKGSQGPGVAQRLGLDQISLRGGTAAEGGGAVIGLGKQVSKRLFFGYEHALAAAGGYWQLLYRVAGRITLRARTGLENAIDAVWTWRWE